MKRPRSSDSWPAKSVRVLGVGLGMSFLAGNRKVPPGTIIQRRLEVPVRQVLVGAVARNSMSAAGIGVCLWWALARRNQLRKWCRCRCNVECSAVSVMLKPKCVSGCAPCSAALLASSTASVPSAELPSSGIFAWLCVNVLAPIRVPALMSCAGACIGFGWCGCSFKGWQLVNPQSLARCGVERA